MVLSIGHKLQVTYYLNFYSCKRKYNNTLLYIAEKNDKH